MNKFLLEWMREQPEIDDKMIFKNAAIHQMCFIRDTVCAYFLHVPVFVNSTHRSKSLTLPVYRFRLNNGIVVICRENFYGWVVSINSPFNISIPEDLTDTKEDMSPQFCEGFHFDQCYPFATKNFRLSTLDISDNYKFYTLMYFLNKMDDTNVVEDKIISDKDTLVSLCKRIIDECPKMQIYDIFGKTYYCAYDLDFSKQHNMKCYYVGDDEGVLDDFIERVLLSDDLKRMLIKEISHINFGMECT